MTRRISLALTLHNHQPIGNFGWVLAEVFDQAYRPMVEALLRHPRVRVGLHYTGPLLEWLRAERPAFIAELRELVERDQVEILGGGLYEPVLASLPERDRVGQLVRMADAVEATFGRRPSGAWLAERVWEPDMPTSLSAAGYAWTILDDSHFRAAAIPEDQMWGPYTTEDQGHLIRVFGTEQGLRYRIPFQEVDEVIEYLRDHATDAGDRLGTMGDDGEKFGAWPTTWEHCWGEGRWVERFFEAIESSAEWLTTVRPSDWLAANPPVGRVYLPTGSYSEMGEWALPPEEARVFSAALHHAQETSAPEARWLRGAFWRNFQVRYREVNDLHKQMLRVSDKVERVAPGPERDSAMDHLYRGQSNDCYWHGLFGGIYIAHMRAATLAHLIAAEDIADAALGTTARGGVLDLDLDGRDELMLANEGETVSIDLDEGAGIGAWDLRAARHALTGVLRRRPEAYHETLREHDRATKAAATEGGAAADGNGDDAGAASIHERVQVKEAGLADRLVYDDYERRSGLVRFLPKDPSPASWGAGGRGDLGDFATDPFRIVNLEPGHAEVARDGQVVVDEVAIPVSVETRIRLAGGRLDPRLEWSMTIENRGDAALVARVGTEWAITMLGGGGNPDAWWDIAGERTSHDGAGAAEQVERVRQGNDWLGVEIETLCETPADAWHAPIETVSNSEAGFERVYQGSALLLSWQIRLEPGELFTTTIQHRVKVAADRAKGDPASV
ncbi:MAG TPA: alpha-amylase/4-alpha-glucanotransferase domain-containing protein [Candidatus Limnocylindria bacterium]|nr:alpha-amylase/4-alpha-glucanotransferase domain-containing protein [Candidatus Limnocylindria bacterium]